MEIKPNYMNSTNASAQPIFFGTAPAQNNEFSQFIPPQAQPQKRATPSAPKQTINAEDFGDFLGALQEPPVEPPADVLGKGEESVSIQNFLNMMGVPPITDEERTLAKQLHHQTQAMLSNPQTKELSGNEGKTVSQKIEEDPTNLDNYVDAVKYVPPVIKKVKQQKKEEPIKEINKFSDEDKMKIALSLIKRKGRATKTYKVNSFCSVTFRTILDTELQEFNLKFQKINITGDRRRLREYIEAKDVNGNPIKRDIESDTFFNSDSERAIRSLELAFYIESLTLNGSLESMPSDIEERLSILGDYNPSFLDVIYKESYIPFKELLAEARRDFPKL